ncbi:hypothetical protein BH10PSE17_BH10PSE17_17840 [soil metagenome]
MIYCIHLLDKPDSLDQRVALRPVHRAYLGSAAERMAFAGPLIEDGKPVGSLLAIDFDSIEAAHAWLDAEPYTMAGVYAQRTVHAFTNLWPQKVGFPPAA